MKNRCFLWGILLLSFMAMSCRSHYQLTDVQRGRILIDNRYDSQVNPKATTFLAPYRAKVDSIMSPVVGTIAKYMAAQKPESEISNLLADILIWGGKAYDEHPDLSVYNVGGIRAAFAKGKVTYGDVVEVAPFENKICFLTLTGEKLLELFQQIAKRGGEGVSHSVNLVITSDRKLKSALLNGKEINPQASYRIATLDYLAQGNDGLVAFKSSTDVKSPQTTENNVRFIIMDYFREQQKMGKIVDAHIEGRIVIND
jgi:2',3'-cyclic-nucleotide 2'-phosphodiesterase (5'-nucleotidase family)